MNYKCLYCKKTPLTEKDFAVGFCPVCFNRAQKRNYNFNFIACPECGKKLEGEDLKNAYYSCCPYCLTLIEEEFFENIE